MATESASRGCDAVDGAGAVEQATAANMGNTSARRAAAETSRAVRMCPPVGTGCCSSITGATRVRRPRSALLEAGAQCGSAQIHARREPDLGAVHLGDAARERLAHLRTHE